MLEPTSENPSQQAQDTSILEFWLGHGLAQDLPSGDLNPDWFLDDAALDMEVRARFGQAVQQALPGGLMAWESPPHSRLALVIVLDQFCRNSFCGMARAFNGDARARQLRLRTLTQHQDQQLHWVGRAFLHMPLMHAEDLALQKSRVAGFFQLLADGPVALKPTLQGNLDFAIQYQSSTNPSLPGSAAFCAATGYRGVISTAAEVGFVHNSSRFRQ